MDTLTTTDTTLWFDDFVAASSLDMLVTIGGLTDDTYTNLVAYNAYDWIDDVKIYGTSIGAAGVSNVYRYSSGTPFYSGGTNNTEEQYAPSGSVALPTPDYWWPFSPADWVTLTDSNSGLTLTQSGTVVTNMGQAAEQWILFSPDATGRYAYSATNQPKLTSVFTVSCWLSVGSYNATRNMGAVGRWGSATPNRTFSMYVGDKTNMSGWIYQSNNTAVETPKANIYAIVGATNVFAQFSMVADGSKIRLYTNGAECGSGTSYDGTLQLSTANKLTFLRLRPEDATYPWWGGIDDIRIWTNTALTSAQELQLYQGGRQ